MEREGMENGDFGPGLKVIRKRRLMLWMLIAIYLPAMWGAQQIAGSFLGAMPVFWCWCALLVVVVTYSALARCPRCGNYFHMNGMTLMYLRKCLHCQLHVTADRRAAKKEAAAVLKPSAH